MRSKLDVRIPRRRARWAELAGIDPRAAVGLPLEVLLPPIAGGAGAALQVPPSQEGYESAPGIAGLEIPFTQASKPVFEEGPTWSGVELSAAEDTRLEAKAIPANGYTRAVYLLFETETAGEAGTGAFNEDGPWSLVKTFEVEDQGGHTIHGPLPGYDARQTCKWGGYYIVPDPANWDSYSNSVTAPNFTLVWHPEVGRTGAGALTNMTETTNYHLRLILSSISGAYSTAPTKAPKLRIRTVIELWPLPVAKTEPEPGLPEGRMQEQRPPLLGMIQRWTEEPNIKVSEGQNRIAFKRVGQMIRTHILIARNAEKKRNDEVLGDPLQIEWATVRFRTIWRQLLKDRACAAVPSNKADTGVYPILYNEGEQIFAGANEWNGWLSTVNSTAFALNMPNCKEGTLTIITNDIAVAAIGEVGRREVPGQTATPEPRMIG